MNTKQREFSWTQFEFSSDESFRLLRDVENSSFFIPLHHMLALVAHQIRVLKLGGYKFKNTFEKTLPTFYYLAFQFFQVNILVEQYLNLS